jgi:cytosine/adenosine deaminase-related metal-dependent hydrolase
MLKYISADWIFPVNSNPIKNGVIGFNSDGEIREVLMPEDATSLNLEITCYQGAVVPGFINTHCHLELSHMLKQIPEHTGLVEFVQHIIKNRQHEADEIETAMHKADAAMYQNGIVAVGDISNQGVSSKIKRDSPIYYHTFIEAMGFNPERATAIMEYARATKLQFDPLPASIVPHAPYSVSAELFSLIEQEAGKNNDLLSVHNQESAAEDAFFIDKTGDFLKLYEFLGLDIHFYQPAGKSSLQTWLPGIKQQKTLLVHNTFTREADIAFAEAQSPNVYWCLCPQANLYIEHALPDVDLLRKAEVKITLGTDSLASNHQLNILAEMKTLQQQKQVPFEELLKWATNNGAAFLGLNDQLGSIEPGKKPGLNLIQLSADWEIVNDQVEKII